MIDFCIFRYNLTMTAFEPKEQKLFFQIDTIAERNFDSITKETRNIISDKLETELHLKFMIIELKCVS